MCEYKVGDFVRATMDCELIDVTPGKSYEVVEINSCGVAVIYDDGGDPRRPGVMYTECWEKVELEPGMKWGDLITGDIVEFGNGDFAMVLRGTKNGDIISGDTWMPINDRSKDKLFDYNSSLSKTILKIHRPQNNRSFLKLDLSDTSTTNKECIWSREDEEPTQELTVAEIEAKLGYKVKVVK